MSALTARPGVPPDAAPPPAGAGRVSNLDVLRAMAALAVLVTHAYALGGRAAPVRARFAYDVPLISLASTVWLFFGISGYVIARPFIDRLVSGRALPDWRGYARRRGLRIFPIYWVALGVFVAIQGTVGTQAWQLVFHLLLLNNLLPGRQEALYSVAWTLTLEVLFYACVPVLAGLIRRAGRADAVWLARAIAISWALSIVFTGFADLLGDGRTGLWLRASLPAMWQMFCPGLLLALAPHLPPGRLRRLLLAPPVRRAGWWAAVAGLLIAAALLAADAPLRWGVAPYELLTDAARPLFAVGYGLLLAAAIAARPWRRRGLVALGTASYGIYLLHPVLALALQRAGLVPLGRDTLAAFGLHALLLAAVTVPLALASWRWFERPLLGLAAAPQSMRDFWNERAREDAFYFVDTRQPYGAPDAARFWDAEPLVDYVLDGLGVALAPTAVVLEIGCGLGRMTRVLSARSTAVLALDVSDEMLARARRLNPDLDNVTWVLGDGTTLGPIGDQTVDACFSTVVLQHVPDPQITLAYVRELGRVLRRGGWAALQVSTDPRIHRPRAGMAGRLRAAVGRGPRGQGHRAWLGAPVRVADVRAAGDEVGLELEHVWGEGSQYTQLLLRRR